MTSNLASGTARRRFLEYTSVAASAALLAPRYVFAEASKVDAPGLVEQARKGAASATITVQKLRGNVSVLMGAGGNIAVLPVATPSSSSTPVLPAHAPRSLTLSPVLAPIR
jgi:hypothetical protein